MTFPLRAARLALLTSTTLLLAACSIPTTNVVQAGEPASGISQATAVIYFVRDGAQTPVPRTVGGPGSLQAAVEALFSGPSTQDRQQGLATALPPLTAVPKVSADRTQVLIRLPAGTPPLTGTALLQLVCTVRYALRPLAIVVSVAGPKHQQRVTGESDQKCPGALSSADPAG